MQNDYIDFKFGDHWASEFNLLAVSSSDRYTPPVYGSVNPNIATIMGKKGVYKWKTQVNEKIFNINIAFDSVTIAQLNQIKQWLQPNKIQKLIFSEEPYKYYWAALNAEIDFSHLPFIEGEKQVGERTIIEGVYKGEMVISFVCIDNDGYSTEGTFEGLETENPSNTIKGNDFVLTDADNDYIEDLKIEGKSEQETKYNNTLSDTDFADVNSRSVEKAWKTNNLAQIQAKNGEVTISAPYQYSGIAQEQREALIDHKYFASAEINTDSLDTALEIAGKNITNSIEGKDINITDGLVGPVDDLVVSGDASQDKLYNNEINSSFLEDLDNWEEINEADLSRKKQTAIIESDKKYGAATQKTEESNIGDKYYLSTKIKADSVDTVLEVETEKGNVEGSNITINDASDNKMRDFKLYGKSQQDNYEEEVLGEGEYITYNNNDNYDKYTKIEVNGNSAQEVIEEVPGTEVEGDNLTVNGITVTNKELDINGNVEQDVEEDIKPSSANLSKITVLGQNTNLFNATDSFQERTVIGLTFTPIENSSIIKINGTATSDKTSLLGKELEGVFEIGKTYYGYTNNENFEILFELYGTDVEVPIKTVSSFTMSSEYKKINLILKGTNLNGKTYNNEEIGIKIEEGKITNYTPYGQGSCSFVIANGDKTQKREFVLPIQKPMLKEDYFDFKNKKEIHNWSRATFTGEEKWALNATYTNTIRFSLGVSYLNANKIGYCNRSFIRTTQAHGDYEYMFYSSDLLYFNISKSSLPADKQNLEGFTELLKQWNSEGEPLELYYQTGEIEELALTDEQIAIGQQIDKAKLYLGTSNIYSDDEIAPYFTLVYNHILPSPSPEAPSEIQNVEGNIDITVCNKNLFNNTKTISNVTYNSEEDKWIFNLTGRYDHLASKGTFFKNIKANTNYTIYLNILKNTANNIITFNTDKTIWNAYFNIQAGKTGVVVNNIKTKEDLSSALYDLWFSHLNTITGEFEVQIMICEGSETDNNYVKYQEQLITFPLQEGQRLYNGDYLARDGIHHVRDVYTFKAVTSLASYNNNRFGTNVSAVNSVNTANILSDKIVGSDSTKENTGYITGGGGTIVIYGNPADTVKSFNERFVGTKIEYPLAKEKIEAYTPEQQEAYNNLTHLIMYNGQNTLSSQNELKPQLKWEIPESPSPDYFIEIENVTGDINIKIYNKNLLDLTKCGFSNCVKNEDGSVRSNINNNYYATITTSQLNDFILQNKGKSLTFSFEGISTKTIGFYIPCKRANSDSDYFETIKTGNSITMQIPEDLESLSYIQIRWNRQSTPFTDTTTVINNIQLELNDVKTDFIEHEEQLITFPLQEGQKLMQGDYLADDGIHHIKKQKEFDGTEAYQTQAQPLDNIFYTAILINDMKQLLRDNLLSSHFKGVLSPSNNVGISGSYLNYLYFGIDVETIGALPTQTEAEKKELFKTWLAQQKTTGTPVIVEYELAEEEIEPYTEEQQEAYNQLCTHREITYIQTTNKFQPNMQIEYTKKPQYQSQLTVANTQQTLSLIYQTNIDDTRILISNIDSNPNTIEFTNPVLINLTKTFGEGKEPTKDWCDQNLTFFKCEEGGAPSIETSSRVKTVGSNINLFDPDNHIELDGQYRHYSEGEIVGSANFFGIKIPVLGNMVYSVNSNFSRNGYSNLCYYDKDFTFMWGEPFTEGQTFRTPFNCRYITLALNKNYDWFTLTYGEIPIQKVDYNLANIDTQISGYDSQFKSFPLAKGQELLQLPDGTQDTLEADGIHKRVGKIIINGTENWLKQNGVNHEKTWRFIFSRTNGSLSSAKNNCYCDKFINYSADDLWNEDIEGIAVSKSQVIIRINSEKAESVVELKQLLQDNNLVLYLPKISEEIIPYSNAQKTWYDEFEIYRKNTQITTIAETKPWYSFTYDINDTYSVNSTKVNEYEKLGLIFNNLEDRPRFIVNRTAEGSGMIKMRKPLVVDLTNVFGAGKEPDLAWCLENITFDNSCEYGTPSPNVPSELISVGSNPIKIENKSRNLIKEQNLLNWTKEYCTAERLTEKYDNRNIYRISFENHKKGTISTRIQQKKGNMVLSIYARVIQADDPTINRLVVAKVTSDSSSSTSVSHKSLENLIGEWQKIYIPITAESISDAAELVLEIQHNADTDDSTIIDLCMPQLEEGFTPHDYIPYAPEKVNNLTFTTPLRQLKNGVKDEFSKNGIIRRVGEHTIKSSDTVYWIVFNQDKDYITICGQLGIYVRGDSSWNAPSFYCNRIEDCTSLYRIAQAKNPAPSRTKEGIGIIDSEYRMCLRADLMGIVETDTEEDMIRKYKVLLDEKPFTIYYEKEVADIEPLTELQKNTLANLVTRKQYDYWLVSGDLNPEVELSYKLTSSINDIHPWVTGSNLLDKTWFYNDNNIHTKPYVEVDTGDADKSGISATRPIYLLNSGTETANLSLTFDYINIETPLTIQTYSGKFTDDGFVEEAKVSEITIEPFTNYQPFKDIYDNNPANWKIEIDSTLGEVYLRHNTDETKVLNLNRFNKDHTFLSLADCNFVDYDKVFPTIISEIEGTAIENTIFNKVTVANIADNYRLKNVNVEWKHTYL